MTTVSPSQRISLDNTLDSRNLLCEGYGGQSTHILEGSEVRVHTQCKGSEYTYLQWTVVKVRGNGWHSNRWWVRWRTRVCGFILHTKIRGQLLQPCVHRYTSPTVCVCVRGLGLLLPVFFFTFLKKSAYYSSLVYPRGGWNHLTLAN